MHTPRSEGSYRNKPIVDPSLENAIEVTVTSGHGSYVVRERGGRIAELRPSADVENVFFDGFDEIGGGDRMWIAPEVELFYDGPPTPDGWRCPPTLDPGTWSMARVGDSVELTQEALGARMRRTVEPLTEWEPAGHLRWSGYRVTSEVDSPDRWSAWQLLMLPSPADVFIGDAHHPIVYYPPPPEISDGRLRANGRPPRMKVGFEPSPDGKVAAAALTDTDPGAMVMISASLDPGGTYVDVPPDGGAGTALQVFDSAGDGFCELELHAPLETRRIESVVVAAWGSRADRLTVVDSLVRDRNDP